MEKHETIKRGSRDWWTWIAMFQAAEQERKRLKLSPMEPVTIKIELCNQFIDSVNRNPFKKAWLLLMNGDMHSTDRSKIGNVVSVEAEDGTVHDFFKKE